MGWPSSEMLVWEWSPKGWNKPLESATTPGLASVTASLKPEAGEVAGSFPYCSRSRSLCA